MAVNNFAPAEFGGYVLGVNGSGGGGGGSMFDEQYGIDGWYDVEITFQLPELSTDSLEGASVGVVISIINTEGDDLLYISNAWKMQIMLISDNKYTLHVPYHTGDDSISIFNISEIHSVNNVYISADDGFTGSGGVEWNDDDYRFEVSGDGSAIIPLQYA